MKLSHIFTKQISPTKGDFDRATAQPWKATTCLVAQLMIRKGRTPTISSIKDDPIHVARLNNLRDLQAQFDVNYAVTHKFSLELANLAQIRKSLPWFNWPWQKLI